MSATIWYSSDLHLYHENIIRFANRPFANAKEMNEMLLTLHNERVKPQDHWWNLGDITMERGNEWPLTFLAKFHGHKRLIMGNHDHYNVAIYRKYFEKIQAVHRFQDILFSHIPIHPQSLGRAVANVHGHTHDHPDYPAVPAQQFGQVWEGKSQVPPRMIPYVNICVERTDYAPIPLEEVQRRIAHFAAAAEVTP